MNLCRPTWHWLETLLRWCKYRKRWLLGAPCYWRILSSWYTASFVKRMCIKRAHDGQQEIEWKRWHIAHLMVILMSTKEELHSFFFPHFWLTQSSQATPFTAYSPIPWTHNGAENYALLEEDGVLISRWYLPGRRVWRCTAQHQSAVYHANTCWAWL